MDWTYVRLAAHLLLIIDAATAGSMLWLARGQSVRIERVRYAIAGLVLAALWLTGLAMSIRAFGPVPRDVLVPLLGSLELGAGVLFTAWLVTMYRRAFRLVIKLRTPPLLGYL